MLNIYSDEEIQIMEESRQAMMEFKSKREEIPTKTERIQQQIRSYDYGKDMFEEYDEVKAEGKVKIDMVYFEHLTKHLDESLRESLHESMTSLFRIVDKIYEHVNIEPEVFGANVDVNLLNESIDVNSSTPS